MQHKATQAHIDLLNRILGTEARKWGNARELPSAIRVTEKLEPTGGKEIPVYPASYPNSGGDPIYDLSGRKYSPTGDVIGFAHCVIDSYQSQANRMEPAFKSPQLKELVPQIEISVPRKAEAEETTQKMNALDVAHRVADFRIRLSGGGTIYKDAIRSFDQGDALPLLRVLPTSVLFGFWDSRGEMQTKHARILMSRIDAFEVVPCLKHSVYSGQYSKDEFVNLLGIADANPDEKVLSERGFSNAPGSGLGGVLVQGGITRTSVLSLTDIARIHCMNGKDPDVAKTNAARRYLFCLGMIAEAYQRECGTYGLRSGCELVPTAEEFVIDLRGGSKNPEFLGLCKDQAALVELAKEAMTVLEVTTDKTSLSVTTDSLRAEFDAAVGKKADKTAKAAARKAAKTNASSATKDPNPS